MSEERCETCKFCKKCDIISVCRRNPPQLSGWFLQGGDYPELAQPWQSQFPEVDRDSWCGEYRASNT